MLSKAQVYNSIIIHENSRDKKYRPRSPVAFAPFYEQPYFLPDYVLSWLHLYVFEILKYLGNGNVVKRIFVFCFVPDIIHVKKISEFTTNLYSILRINVDKWTK